jgi:hypothetical protein
LGWHHGAPWTKGSEGTEPKIRIATRRNAASAITNVISDDRDRRSEELDRDFRRDRKIGQLPSESPVNIVGFRGQHRSEIAVNLRRNTHPERIDEL